MALATTLALMAPSISLATPPQGYPIDLSAADRDVILDALAQKADGPLHLVDSVRGKLGALAEGKRLPFVPSDIVILNSALMLSTDPRAPAVLERLRKAVSEGLQ